MSTNVSPDGPECEEATSYMAEHRAGLVNETENPVRKGERPAW